MRYAADTSTVSVGGQCSFHDVKQIGDALGVPWDRVDVEQFRMGLNMELAPGERVDASDVAGSRLMVAGEIVLAHLHEVSDYYTQLAAMTCSPLRTFHEFRTLLL